MLKLSCAPAAELAASETPRAVFVYEGGPLQGMGHMPPALRKRLLEAAQAEGWKGSRGECANVTLQEPAGPRRYVVCGLGKAKGATPEAMRRAAAAAAHFAKARWTKLAVFPGELP